MKTPGFHVVSKVELVPVSEYLLNIESYIIMQVHLPKKNDTFSGFRSLTVMKTDIRFHS